MPKIDGMVEMVSPPQGRARNNTITLVGCGSGGCNMIRRIVAKGLPRDVNTVMISSDDDNVADESGTFMGLSRESMRSDPHPEIRWSHYEETLDEMVNTFEDSDISIFIMSLGGQMGTGLAPVAAKAAFIAGSTTLGFAVMPFSVEKERHTRAKRAISFIKEELPNTVVLENDKLIPISGGSSINDAFGLMDNLISSKLIEVMEAMTFSETYVDEVPVAAVEEIEAPMAKVLEVA